MTISEFVSENAVPLTIAAAGVSLAGVYALRSRDGMRSVPRATDLGGGKAIKEGEVEGHWNAYDNYFTQGKPAITLPYLTLSCKQASKVQVSNRKLTHTNTHTLYNNAVRQTNIIIIKVKPQRQPSSK